jgi:hypothetical protein
MRLRGSRGARRVQAFTRTEMDRPRPQAAPSCRLRLNGNLSDLMNSTQPGLTLAVAMPHPPQPLASLQQVLVTPSRQDGVPEDLEDDLRVMGCVLIQELGVMLEL